MDVNDFQMRNSVYSVLCSVGVSAYFAELTTFKIATLRKQPLVILFHN